MLHRRVTRFAVARRARFQGHSRSRSAAGVEAEVEPHMPPNLCCWVQEVSRACGSHVFVAPVVCASRSALNNDALRLVCPLARLTLILDDARGRCALELFVFIKMGGNSNEIAMRLAVSSGAADQTAARKSILASLSKFDTDKAQCLYALDKEQLMAVIETSFGSTKPFSKLVRAIFDESLREQSERRP